MIRRLAEHGLLPSDLSISLINDAKQVAQSYSTGNSHGELMDIRYAVLSHLYVLAIADGFYDSRSRSVMKVVATMLEVPVEDLMKIERTIAEKILLSSKEQLKKDGEVVEKRNKADSKGRWALAAAATLAGGAVIGLTAGLAAPLIGAGIGSALGLIGVSGAAGVGTFMGSAAGLAIITTGGVLTGGGLSGYKMIKRTKGIDEFEFISLESGLKKIAENKEKRRIARRKRWRKELRERKERELAEAKEKEHRSRINTIEAELKVSQASLELSRDNLDASSQISLASRSFEGKTDILWEAKEDSGDESASPEIYVEKDEDIKTRPTNVLITISGWVTEDHDDFTLPFSTLEPDLHGDQYALVWESKSLKELGSALTLLAGEVTSFIVQQGLQATLLPALMAGLAAPLWALKLTYFLDNPWGNGLEKAKRAGRVLADTLATQIQGNRPVTLIGFSLGARVIFYCLRELAKKQIFGVIEDVYIVGGPIMANKNDWDEIISICAGKLYNGYLKRDWVLGYLYRASSALWQDVAGLNPIENVEGVENILLDEIVTGHLEYRRNMPKILQRMGFKVWRDYFDDEEEEEKKDKEEMEEELRKLAAEKQRQKDKDEKDKNSRKKAEKIVLSEYTQGGIHIKELASTLPPLVMNDAQKSEITPMTSALPRSSVGKSRGNTSNAPTDSI